MLVAEGRWVAIDRTFGVLGVIKFGETPARVPDGEIRALRERADASGVIRLPPEPPKRMWARGDQVKILAGQFASFDAIHSGMSNASASRRVFLASPDYRAWRVEALD